ncbi:thymidine phosphorylase [Verrucomicrobiaceae bacterium N1E253]|uniref:thymidine phosphorylase n=1 Tax=Oceaniferula marina TaxID=2748318 RepID=A0A851GS80_9BACT|nr:thymidine phosphorylase [Oceaniferula marina]
MMLPQEIIRKKRDQETLTPAEIESFVDGVTSAKVTDSQIAAFAMAVYFNGMNRREATALTLAMRDSGEVLDWKQQDLPGPIVDKHSTGGVGDGTSIMLGPMLAACGAFVPMISGRGLGHTGGTLDKLQSIPGYHVTPDKETFRRVVSQCGVAIIGQTAELAPADRRIYAVRDVTATVESIPLITASILSKKLAEGIDCLVMDVKSGNGAFMKDHLQSETLAKHITSVANAAGVKTSALVTDMNQCLGDNAGNALEIREAIHFLTGQHQNPRLKKVIMALGSELLQLSGLAPNNENAQQQLEQALQCGAAAETFANMCQQLGAPGDLLERHTSYLPSAPVIRPIFAKHPGVITSIDTRQLGLSIVGLGGGRSRPQDQINPAVGLSDIIQPGQVTDSPLATIHAQTEDDWQQAAKQIQQAITIGQQPPSPQPVILNTIASG